MRAVACATLACSAGDRRHSSPPRSSVAPLRVVSGGRQLRFHPLALRGGLSALSGQRRRRLRRCWRRHDQRAKDRQLRASDHHCTRSRRRSSIAAGQTRHRAQHVVGHVRLRQQRRQQRHQRRQRVDLRRARHDDVAHRLVVGNDAQRGADAAAGTAALARADGVAQHVAIGALLAEAAAILDHARQSRHKHAKVAVAARVPCDSEARPAVAKEPRQSSDLYALLERQIVEAPLWHQRADAVDQRRKRAQLVPVKPKVRVDVVDRQRCERRADARRHNDRDAVALRGQRGQQRGGHGRPAQRQPIACGRWRRQQRSSRFDWPELLGGYARQVVGIDGARHAAGDAANRDGRSGGRGAATSTPTATSRGSATATAAATATATGRRSGHSDCSGSDCGNGVHGGARCVAVLNLLNELAPASISRRRLGRHARLERRCAEH